MSEVMKKHTPGPWRFQGSGHDAEVVGEGALVCSLGYDDGFGAEYAYENARANGPLIAAAPELLAALEKVLGVINESDGVVGWHKNGDIAEWGEFSDIIDAGEAALAKARGEVGDED